MNKWIALFALLTILPGCSVFDTKEEPTIYVTPTLAETNTAPVIVQPTVSDGGEIFVSAPAPVETRDLTPAVPRVKQAQVIGVVRELVRSGCSVEKVATTDGIHYSQLIVTCGPPQVAPAIQ